MKKFLALGFGFLIAFLTPLAHASYENAILLCGDNEYLAGNDGTLTCKTAADIVTDAGGFTVDTDDQGLDVLSLVGTTLNISLDDDGVGNFTLDLVSLLGSDDQTAAEVSYNNATSSLTATDVQAAIDELEDEIDVVDTNDYVDSVAFDTGTGVLTIGRTGSLIDLTQDLDGRYLESFTELDPKISTLTNTKWCSTNGFVITCTEDAPAAGISGSGADNLVTLWNGTGAIDASAVTETELNILDGATLSTAELNILTGATLSTAELNILTGATLSTAELNLLDLSGLTAGHVLRATGAATAAWGAILDADLPATIARDAELHDAVTLGTANGLTLSTQELSLGLASSGVTGALSGTDWDTFNGKATAITTASISSSSSVINNVFYLCDATSGEVTLTLPAASANAQISVKKIDSSANNCVLDGNGSETIDGALTRNVTAQWVSIKLISDGTAWFIQ